jgi:DNA-binding transcriptional MerR regulator
MSTSRRLTVGQVARQAGLTPRAVRFYEAKGILPTAPRSANGYRLYSTDTVESLQFVGRLRTIGLGLVDIREIMRLRADGVAPPERVIALLETRVRQIDRELTSMHEMRGALADLLHRAHRESSARVEVRLCRLAGGRSHSPPLRITRHRQAG